MASELNLGIASLAIRLYRRFTFPTFCALVILTSVAAIFSTSFFNGLYVAHLAETTELGRDSEQRENEYDRLVRDTAMLTATISRMLEATYLEAKRKEKEALEQARFEEEERLPETLRGCGPICQDHLRTAARWRTEREQIEAAQARLQQLPTAPASRAWDDLLQFHTQVITIMRSMPINDGTLSLPGAPRPLSALTKALARNRDELFSFMETLGYSNLSGGTRSP